MPGMVKSIAYLALPSTFDGMSRRGREVPRIVKLSGCLSVGLVGTRCDAADRASSPNAALRPEPACVTRERFAAHSEALTPHGRAAAATSISLAAAPATRIPYSPVPRTAVGPP